MSRLQTRTLTRILIEIGVVTGGILIAFALDAWWDNRAQARQEQAHLRALASDFRENIERLKALIEHEEAVVSNSQSLLKLAQSPGPHSTESIHKLLGQVFSSQRFDPVLGAYEALVNSAGLTLISDETLRSALANFAAQVDARYFEQFSDQQYFVFAREFAGRLRFFEDAVSVRQPEGAYEDLIRDPKFQDYLAMRYYAEFGVAQKYRELLQHAEGVLAKIQAQLNDR